MVKEKKKLRNVADPTINIDNVHIIVVISIKENYESSM